jgi:hypothetical protein
MPFHDTDNKASCLTVRQYKDDISGTERRLRNEGFRLLGAEIVDLSIHAQLLLIQLRYGKIVKEEWWIKPLGWIKPLDWKEEEEPEMVPIYCPEEEELITCPICEVHVRTIDNGNETWDESCIQECKDCCDGDFCRDCCQADDNDEYQCKKCAEDSTSS